LDAARTAGVAAPFGSLKAYPPPKAPVNQRELALPRPSVLSAILRANRVNATTAQPVIVVSNFLFAAAAISILVGRALLLRGALLDRLSQLNELGMALF
jgi:hypothetical protein